MRVLQRLLDAALRREIALDHLARLGLHHLRIGGGGFCDFDEGLWIETHLGREGQPFRQRKAVKPENEIDRELGAAAIARTPDVEAAGEDHIENVFHIHPAREPAEFPDGQTQLLGHEFLACILPGQLLGRGQRPRERAAHEAADAGDQDAHEG